MPVESCGRCGAIIPTEDWQLHQILHTLLEIKDDIKYKLDQLISQLERNRAFGNK